MQNIILLHEVGAITHNIEQVLSALLVFTVLQFSSIEEFQKKRESHECGHGTVSLFISDEGYVQSLTELLWSELQNTPLIILAKDGKKTFTSNDFVDMVLGVPYKESDLICASAILTSPHISCRKTMRLHLSKLTK